MVSNPPHGVFKEKNHEESAFYISRSSSHSSMFGINTTEIHDLDHYGEQWHPPYQSDKGEYQLYPGFEFVTCEICIKAALYKTKIKTKYSGDRTEVTEGEKSVHAIKNAMECNVLRLWKSK